MLKRDRLRDEKDRPVVEKEYAFYQKVVDNYQKEDGIEIKQKWVEDLKEINSKCWDGEAAVRLGRTNGLTLEEVGQYMLRLRDFNRIRIGLKNEIMEETNFHFDEVQTPQKTNLKTPLPEAIEKVAITTLKLNGAPSDTERHALEKEFDFYTKVVDAYRAEGVMVQDEWVEELKEINSEGWKMEADITQGREDTLGLAEVGRRAILLRDRNKIRIALKKEIANEAGLDFYEIKTETT
jgi:transcription elongation factor Elf1